MRKSNLRVLILVVVLGVTLPLFAGTFNGKYFSGEGDVEYLQLLDISRRMFDPDPEYQNISMLYTPEWNGFIEGPTWNAWWIQNSYGPTYCALPFYAEPYLTFLQNAQDLWFDQMGDGNRIGAKDLQAPDGSLCDAARPGWIMYKQGDGRVDIHDWGMEFTAAGIVLQSELLLIGRDPAAIEHYLPMLERSVNFIESRRDVQNNLFLAGPAGNLLAPSYAGWQKKNGSFGKAYLSGLSITYIAALDRMIELEKLAKRFDQVKIYERRQNLARQGLDLLATDEGYFIKSLDPDGTRHGVYGAEKYGYFEASPNHDAIAFRVIDDAQSEKIYQKIASIPGLRRHHVIIANEPGLDDMYDPGTSWLWKHGTWVNGGHWSTCEARMMMAYARLGKYDDIQRSMEHMLGFAKRFRMDNPLVEFGSKVYQPKKPINLCYDSFGPPAAMVRGLFEYLYSAETLTLIPHIPQGIHQLSQHFPIRWGDKKLYLSTYGHGDIVSVSINDQTYQEFKPYRINLIFDSIPNEAHISIIFEKDNNYEKREWRDVGQSLPVVKNVIFEDQINDNLFKVVKAFYNDGSKSIYSTHYEIEHASLAIKSANALLERKELLKSGNLASLPDSAASAAISLYQDTSKNLCIGLSELLESYSESLDPDKKAIHNIWQKAKMSLLK